VPEKSGFASSVLEKLLAQKRGFMKKKVDELEDELRPEYDFAKMQGGVRGKYVQRYRSGTNLVLYRAVPDRFNWMMFDLNMYTIAIVKSNFTNIGTKPLTCASPLGSNIVPKIEVSIPLIKNSRPALKCSPGSHEVGDP
jgi:mRNA-degrading endonuclease RelE of RelBE toxin-antitoxin system